MTNFHELGLSKQTVATLFALGYETPTPIQAQAIPQLLEGRDMIGLAQTGTGKTAAFGLPIIEMLAKDPKRPDNRTTRTLILAPTRELVNQIAASLKSYVRGTPMKINAVVGGASINKQQLQLEKGTDILVATPGRLLDLIARRAIGLTAVRYLVLDEADQMLDLGFIHDLRKISKMVPNKRQTLLFSATMPKAIADLASDFLKDPVQVSVTPPGKAADKVEQFVHFVVGKNDKTDLLKKSLEENPTGRAMVFLRTKHGAEKLSKHLEHIGFKVASIHGNKSQGQRERALKAFRDNEIRVLVATDVAARGIDIPGVTHVFNYDLPEVPDAYVHRIGRTARAGRDGIAIAFCAPDEARLLRDIERLMNIEITTASGERPEGGRQPRGGAGNNNRGGAAKSGRGGNGQARGNGEGRPERRERPARKPFFAAEGAEGGDRPQRPARANGDRPHGDRPQRDNRRNDDFRGQRRGENTPRPDVDNDLSTTSDFRPAKKQFGPQDGMKNGEGRPARTEPRKEHRKGGNGAPNPHAAHGAHEPAAQRNNRGPRVEAARPAAGGNAGPVKFGNDNRSGQQGRTRRPA
ncbi:Putative ATP-dependent RNA helicase with P-loop hydrolase domain (RhlE gene) [Neorhizobium galegae bv. officinalis bv. officinalis str. HAMBI 1141]|uniref:DEAD-box ATP-dependent RNA helicase RhpA n=2 Tax=Neorhizobium TaxID=1525371 RepID=A0A068T995_NEOGA|nr:DEAD/DEAH box helicase [Neorhizobium galegae]CDN55013.1 Putative ATP-dependent RNA helicase with P-loop hydrolase domain (RhlE gene) [Neorhizobium galegae bv. officinalis bv. officinalis str. HAMBI 1141]